MILRLNCEPNQHNKSWCHRRCVGCLLVVGGLQKMLTESLHFATGAKREGEKKMKM